MSTNFNRRRGAAANKPRNLRTCTVLVPARPFQATPPGEEPVYDGGVKKCGAAVPPNLNGNRCEDHR